MKAVSQKEQTRRMRIRGALQQHYSNPINRARQRMNAQVASMERKRTIIIPPNGDTEIKIDLMDGEAITFKVPRVLTVQECFKIHRKIAECKSVQSIGSTPKDIITQRIIQIL